MNDETDQAEHDWDCLRCAQLRAGHPPTVPEHAPTCPYRGTGRDPTPES